MEAEKVMKDGLYPVKELIGVLNNDFASEKDLCDFIERNIANFCKEELGFEYESHTREYPIFKWKQRTSGSKRLDFMIHSKCGKTVVIECKDPTYLSELCSGIGQMLSYITLLDREQKKIDQFILISTKIDGLTPLVIKQFNLPILFIAMDKKRILICQK